MSRGGDLAQQLINRFEQCKLRAYRDPFGGPWTVGWGETEGVGEGTVWTQEEADKRRDARIELLEIRVRGMVGNLPDEMVGALIDFGYNLGIEYLEKSSLLMVIKSKNWFQACRAILNYADAGGRPRKGLLRRRIAEAGMFCDGIPLV